MKVLYIGAHPDDALLGCGGVLLKGLDKEDEAHIVTLSLCGNNNGLGFHEKDIEKELYKSTAIAGLSIGDLHVKNYENTKLPSFSTEIRNFLEDLDKSYHFDLVYTHSLNDRHQDHQAVAWETMRAFRKRELRCYEIDSSALNTFNPNLYVDITGQFLKKSLILSCFETQKKRATFNDGWMKLAEYRGLASGVKAAEAFELIWRLE